MSTLLARGQADAATWPSPVVIVLSGLEPTVDQDRLKAIIGIFDAHRIPITVALSLDPDAADRPSPGSLPLGLVGSLSESHPTYLEIALDAGATAEPSAYSILRRVSDLQTVLNRATQTQVMHPHRQPGPASTIVVEPGAEADTRLFAGLRAAGICSVVYLTGSGGRNDERRRTGDYWIDGNGVAHIFGVPETAIIDAEFFQDHHKSRSFRDHLRRQATTRQPIVVELQSKALEGLQGPSAERGIEALAELMDDEVRTGIVRYATPATLYRQTRSGPLSYYIIRQARSSQEGVVGAGDGGCAAPSGAAVAPDGFVIVPAGALRIRPETLDKASHAYLREIARFAPPSSSPSDTIDPASGTISPQIDDATLPLVTGYGLKMAYSDPSDPDAKIGLDSLGVLNLPSASPHEMGHMTEAASPARDWTVLVDTCEDDVARDVGEAIERNRAESLTAGEYYATVMPRVPLLDLLQRAKLRAALIDGGPKDDITKLTEDAEVAWRYFDRYVPRYGEVAPATAWAGGDSHYLIVTMWDLGSLLLAATSARRLDLIDDARIQRIGDAVTALLREAVIDVDGARLPVTNWSIDGRPGDLRGYDPADTGRLLIAMRAFDNLTEGALGMSDIVDGWDLEASIRDGELYEFNGNRWKSVHGKLYLLYAQRGFTTWGYDLKPQFDLEAPEADMDRAMAFLHEARRRGPFATEPYATAQVEFGGSEHASLIADVVFAGQVKRYETEGVLTSISEVPIDAEPWFTYQGFVPGESGSEWTVHAPPGHRFQQTERLARENRVLSSKASFLWAAVKQDPYSQRLWEKTRSDASTEYGFVSGFYELNGRPTRTLDINTNAIILEAISYIVNGRQPLLTED